MANIRALATIGLLITLGSEVSMAISPQDIPAEVKSCKTIADDRERLRCFDGLFGSTPKPQASEEGKQGNWSIDETKSPTDGSLQVVAANLVGDNVLDVRAKLLKPPFRPSTITSAINPLTLNNVSMIKTQSKKSGRRL